MHIKRGRSCCPLLLLRFTPRFRQAPEARPTIAHVFNRGLTGQKRPSPAGAIEKIARMILSSLRDLGCSFPFYPQLKLRAIFDRRSAAGNKKGVHFWTPFE
jgi:hypothetical protein